METPPNDLVLRDILFRQIRKCQLMKYEAEAFDRASENSEQKSYAYLLRNIRGLLDMERHRSNRNRIVEKNKQTEKPQPAAPSQGAEDRGKGDRGRSRGRSQSGKGDKVCYKFRDGKCEKAKIVLISRSKTPNQDLVLPTRREMARAVVRVHPLHQQNCRGKRWHEPHAHTFNRENVAVATSVSMKMQLLLQRAQKEPNSPAPKKKASAKAAPCITQRYACIAKGKGLPKAIKAMKDQCQRAVVFSCWHQKWNTSRSLLPANGIKLFIELEHMTTTILCRSQCQSLTSWLPIVHRSLPASCRRSSSSSTVIIRLTALALITGKTLKKYTSKRTSLRARQR